MSLLKLRSIPSSKNEIVPLLKKQNWDAKCERYETVIVQTLTGNKFAVNVYPDLHTVDNLKQLLHSMGEIAPDAQRLIFGGKQLEDGRTLALYGIKNQCTIHLVHRLRGGMMHVTSGREGYEELSAA
eukprot:Colp12_sorted_trinity150504_noHs@29561